MFSSVGVSMYQRPSLSGFFVAPPAQARCDGKDKGLDPEDGSPRVWGCCHHSNRSFSSDEAMQFGRIIELVSK